MKLGIFITVEKCGDGERGILCSKDGAGYPSDKRLTQSELIEKVGHFWMILDPKSEPFSRNDVSKFKCWKSLPEFNNQLGIGLTELKKNRLLLKHN